MSSEVCPFCGKTFKRLKSHLQHCKAASSSKTPPTKQNVKENPTPPSSQLDAASSVKEKKSTRALPEASPPSRKNRETSVVSSGPAEASSSPLPLSVSSALPSTSKKKKLKLSEQIKLAVATSPTPSANVSEKKSRRDLMEAEKPKEVFEGSLERSKSSLETSFSDSGPVVSDPLGSRTKVETATEANSDKIIVKAKASQDFSDSKSKGTSKMKVPRTKKAAQSPLKTKDSSTDLYPKVSTAKSPSREDFLVDYIGEVEDITTINKKPFELGDSQQAKVMLQDVKAMLGRSNKTRQTKRPSILSQIQTEHLGDKIRSAPSESTILSATAPSDESSSSFSELKSVKIKSSKSEKATPNHLQHEGPPQPGITSTEAPLTSGYLSSHVRETMPRLHTVSRTELVKVEPRKTGLLTISPSLVQFSSPNTSHPLPQTLPVRREMLGADGGSKLEVKRQNLAENGGKGAVMEKSLGQVKLRELPEWLACRTPTHPREVMEMMQRGWHWYYRRYIDVKKGGVGGVGMLLAGYCVLSYIWSYPHIKRDRWRKYH